MTRAVAAREGRRPRAVRGPRGPARRGRPDSVSRRRAGAGEGRGDVDQPQRLGGPAWLPVLRAPGWACARRGAATLGSDIAGSVEAVGAGVTRFRPGDEVYGDNLQLMGGFAEYAVAPESVLALKPAELTFAEASTIPQAGADRPAGHGRRRDRGAACSSTGPVAARASFAIQLAKRLGAHVTGVDNADKLEFMRASVPMR